MEFFNTLLIFTDGYFTIGCGNNSQFRSINFEIPLMALFLPSSYFTENIGIKSI